MHRLHPYPDVQVMFRRLLIATLIGLLAALAVALFRHAMVVLETLLLSNDSGSLVNAAQSLPAWRRLVTPRAGRPDGGNLTLALATTQRRASACRHRLYGSPGDRRRLFRYAGKPGEIAGVIAGRGDRQRDWPGRRHDPAGRAGGLAVCPSLHAAE